MKVYLQLLTVAFFWGGTWVAGRIAVTEASPLAVASWRFLLAGLALAGFLAMRRERLRLGRRELILSLALGASGIFLYNIFFLYGLRTIEAGRGALVVAFTPVVIAIFDWSMGGTPMTRLRGLGVVLAMVGCVLVISRGSVAALLDGTIGQGEALIVGCVLTWTAYTFLGRSATKVMSPAVATFWAVVFGWAMLTVAALIDGSLFSLELLSWRGVWSVLFLGLLATAIGFTWYAAAVQQLGATRAAAFINLVPVFAVVLGITLLGESLSAGVLLGGALVMVGVLITTRVKSPEKLGAGRR